MAQQREGLMSKIANAVRGTPVQRLEAEHGAIAQINLELAELEKQRATALLAESADEAVKLSEKIAAARRRLETAQDRLKAFQAQARRDTTDLRARQKQAALAEFEKLFADRAAAAARVEKAAGEFAASIEAYSVAARIPFAAAWPNDLFPSIKIFEGSAYSYLQSRIAYVLRMQPGAAHDLLTKMPARLSGLAEREISLAASIAEDIRTAPLPPLSQIEDAA